jgi:hypothetical protein
MKDKELGELLASSLPYSGKMSHFKTGAVRDAMEGKGFPSMIPVIALRSISKRFEDGANKYGRGNWEKGIPLSRYYDSASRHLWSIKSGDESEDHAGAVLWNIACLMETKRMIDSNELPNELNDL